MRQREKLTDAVVSEATCPPGKKDALLFDKDLRGFALRVTQKGGKTFLLQYRVEGVSRRAVIGAFGEITTTQARKKAEALRGAVRDHRDPVAERRRALREQRAAEAQAKAAEAQAAAAAAAAAAASANTVDRLIERWTALRLAERSASYRARAPRDMRRALAAWLPAPVASFDQDAAVQALDAVAATSGPIAANRLRAVASACWTWGRKRGTVPGNPWQNVERVVKERARDRVLSDREIADLWNAAGTVGYPWQGIIRAMLLTGQRRSEVAGMEWRELDLKAAEWRLPAPRVKNRLAHVVPLPAPALALIEEQPRVNETPLVFAGARGTAPSGFGKLKTRIDAAMLAAAQRDGRALPPWTLHDIRRTVATGLQRLGVRLEVTEAILNHASGSRAGIVGVYQRHRWEPEKRAALDAWAARVLALAAGTEAAENVLHIAAGRRGAARG